jgi:hypothetical protein
MIHPWASTIFLGGVAGEAEALAVLAEEAVLCVGGGTSSQMLLLLIGS